VSEDKKNTLVSIF